MKALVITGGSIKGAYEAGVIKALFDNGFKPDMIHGISAGALNAAFLVSKIHGHGYPKAASLLLDLWMKIESYKDIVKKRYVRGIIGAIFNRFTAFADNRPLKDLVYENINREDISNSVVDLSVGAVDILSGNIKYVGNLNPSILEYTIASAAIPGIMPASKINESYYYDGGLRDSAPISSAIKAGATEIVIVSCKPIRPEYEEININNALEVTDRVIAIVLNEMLRNDISRLFDVNRQVLEGRADKKMIKCRLIQPLNRISVSLMKFDSNDIRNMIELGLKDGNIKDF
jgi:NTE family protein